METKICSQCGKEKPIEDFPFRNKAKGTRRANCKECHSAKVKARYQQNKEVLNQSKAGHSCVKCGYNKCIEALEYHHADASTKIDTVSRLATHYNLIDAKNEMEKCILLCANCHREFHYLERTQNMTLEDFLNQE